MIGSWVGHKSNMKTFIIRLKDNALSEKLADECIEQAKKFNIYPEKFDGINGLTYPEHLDKLNIRPLKKFKKGRPGVFGCLLSHYYVWLQCQADTESYLVLEHDGYMIKAIPKLIEKRFSDILKLDYINPYSKEYTRRIEQDANNPLEIKTVAPGVGSCNEDMNQGAGWYSTGSYAYIIKPHAAKKLVEWIKINGFLPSDQQLGSYAADIKVCDPSIVQLHPYFSPENGLIKAMSMTMNTELLQ